MSSNGRKTLEGKRPRPWMVIRMGPFVWALTPGLLLAVIGVVLFVGLGAVSLLKVWRVTPAGFVPVVKISLLDMFQARTLARSAREHLASGRLRDAAHAWRGAIANHPADVPLLREWVQVAATADAKIIEDGGAPLNQAVMLLRLGGTNMADLELTMRLLWRIDRPGDVLQLGVPVEDKLGPIAAGLVARAMFDLGDMAGFDRVWKRHPAGLDMDPDLQLYRAAWEAHWGRAAGGVAARERLMAAQADPARRVLALELARRIAVARADVDEHERWVGLLVAEDEASLQAHAERWLLLAAHGRREEAQKLAKPLVGSLNGKHATQTRLLVETLVRINMPQEALDVLKRRSPAQLRDVQLWMLQGKILEGLAQWDDLSSLALSVRSLPGMGGALDELSYSMEALAKAKQTRPDVAELASQRAAAAQPGDATASLQASAWLVDAGMAKAGWEVLKKAEPKMKGSLIYWGRRMQAAGLIPDAADMVRCSEQAMAMAPGNPAVANNHAATLVVTGSKPAEAIKLTFENLAKFPRSPDFQINHAIALLLNDRVDEAGELLRTVDADRLTAVQRANFHLAWLEVSVRVRKWGEARERGLLIDRKQLMPLQWAKLDLLRGQVARAN